MKKDPSFPPGSLICIKGRHRKAQHPDDGIVGLIISSVDGRYLVMFTELSGVPALDDCLERELSLFYRNIGRAVTR
jgi:hypothetical protein